MIIIVKKTILAPLCILVSYTALSEVLHHYINPTLKFVEPPYDT